MNKNQAYVAMQQGHKVCNEYYSPEEYAFINDSGLIEYEDGCVVGDQDCENWVKYQDPYHEYEWSICDDYGRVFDSPKQFIPKNHKRTNKRKK